MVETTGIKPDIARKVITNTPRLNGGISAVFETQYSSTSGERYEQIAIKNDDFNKLYNFRDV